VQVLIRLSHMSQTRAWVLWLLGILIIVCGDALNIVALNFAAQSLLEAIGSVQFVSNLVFSVLVRALNLSSALTEHCKPHFS
jgi:hypothetical protein